MTGTRLLLQLQCSTVRDRLRSVGPPVRKMPVEAPCEQRSPAMARMIERLQNFETEEGERIITYGLRTII